MAQPSSSGGQQQLLRRRTATCMGVFVRLEATGVNANRGVSDDVRHARASGRICLIQLS
jgi:hypothetical protein